MSKFKKVIIFLGLFVVFLLIFSFLFSMLGETNFSINLTNMKRGLTDCYKVSGFPFAYGQCTTESVTGTICLAMACSEPTYGHSLNLLIEMMVVLITTFIVFRFLSKYVR